MKLIQRILRVFFSLLYHPFAFTYDLVAAAVSFGNWKDWVFSILPFIEGTRILELGHGPGHLQRILHTRGLFSFAIDESTQMGKIAKKRIGQSQNLARGIAQELPFRNNYFSSIVATFPTDFIFNPGTLSEIRRCLSDEGKLIVLPAAWPKSLMLKWLYKITGESPSALDKAVQSHLKRPFIDAGFQTKANIIEVKSGYLIILISSKGGL